MAIWPFLLMFVPLVLFHEFGHFIVARWCGVRVLSFSIGFGPTLFKWQRGHTEYAIRLLPLGGFVKMLGDDPSAPPEAEMLRNPDAFAAKAVWQRAAIVAAGPIANFILPMITLILVGLIFHGQVVPSRIGAVLPDGPAELAGLRTGDLITAVDGTPVKTFDDMRRVIEDRAGKVTLINYERMGQQQKLQVTPVSHREVLIPELGLVRNVGKIQIVPQPESSAIAVVPGSAAWRAGLRSGDRIAAVAGVPTTRYYEVDEALGKALKLGLPSLNLGVLSLRPNIRDQNRTPLRICIRANRATSRLSCKVQKLRRNLAFLSHIALLARLKQRRLRKRLASNRAMKLRRLTVNPCDHCTKWLKRCCGPMTMCAATQPTAANQPTLS